MRSSEQGLAAWADSGAMALSGRSQGPPLAPPGNPAGHVLTALDDVAACAEVRTGVRSVLPGVGILGERAAVAGLHRRGPWSCGGAFRTIRTTDGWFGLSLARADDVDLVPALVGRTVSSDPWSSVLAWAARTTTQEAGAQAALLGLPHATHPAWHEPRAGVMVTPGGRRAHTDERPLVLDLSALWAGPLASHLLGLSGCRIVKVEDPRRPDGARRGPQAFFDLLNAGHEAVSVDFSSPSEVDRLAALMARADVVIEASRPRALRALGLDADELVRQGTIWLSITARGRTSTTVGFGDDIAVEAGLAVEDAGELLPVGDAVADPLTGVTAAAAASRALLDTRASLIDVSMLHVAREAALAGSLPHQVIHHGGTWWVETSGPGGDRRHHVAPPRARMPEGVARPVGADNRSWWG